MAERNCPSAIITLFERVKDVSHKLVRTCKGFALCSGTGEGNEKFFREDDLCKYHPAFAEENWFVEAVGSSRTLFCDYVLSGLSNSERHI